MTPTICRTLAADIPRRSPGTGPDTSPPAWPAPWHPEGFRAGSTALT